MRQLGILVSRFTRPTVVCYRVQAPENMGLAKKENPAAHAAGFSGVNPGDDLLSHGLSHTTIGAAAFHFRVRDGIGWFHSANFTREAFGVSPQDVSLQGAGTDVPALQRDAPVAPASRLVL